MSSKYVTHEHLANKFEDHQKDCYNKIKEQSDSRHNLSNKITIKIAEIEDHIDIKNTQMLDKIEKILILVTKNADITKYLKESFKNHTEEEDKDRKELINKLDEAKGSRVSKYFFGWAIWALVIVLWAWATLISYSFTSILWLEKWLVRIETSLESYVDRIEYMEDLAKQNHGKN